MTELPQPEVICTHESDLDGFLSGLLLQRLARHRFGVVVPLETYHNHNWRQRPLKEKSAWVADFTFDARLDRPAWVIIDHHAAEARPLRARLIHDPAKSAGLLCYELCREAGLGNATLDRLVHLSNVADLFLLEDPDFALACDYANIVKTYQFWNLHTLLEGELERLLDHALLEVMQVKRRIEDPLGFEWSRKHVVPVSAEVGYVDTVVGNVNLIVHRLLDEAVVPQPVLMTLFRKGSSSVIVSVRSRNGEALKVAERLKGGGHPNAAGATLPRSVQRIEDALDYVRQALNPVPVTEAPPDDLERVFL